MEKRTIQFLLAGLVMMLFGITMMVVGTINNYLTITFDVGKAFIGLCASVLAAGVFVGQFSFGPVVDRHGYKPVMLAGVVLVTMGLSGIIVSYVVWVIPVFFFLIGVGGGTANGVTNLLVADLYPGKSSAYMSLLGVFFGIGALGLPLFTSILRGSGFSYEAILTFVAMFLLLPFLLVLFMKFPGPRRSRAITVKQFLGFIVHPAILLIGFFLFFQGALEALVPVWTPEFLSESHNVSYEKGLYAITVSAGGMTFARLILGRVLMKRPSFRVLVISLFVAAGGLLLLQFGSGLYFGLIGVGILGIGMAASFPVMISYAVEFFPDNAGTAMSLVLGMALIGNFLLNYLTGLVLEEWGIMLLNLVLGGIVMALFAFLFLIRMKLFSEK
ncbi:MAG: MFS transporter [Marinilabiliaceae bacterium]